MVGERIKASLRVGKFMSQSVLPLGTSDWNLIANRFQRSSRVGFPKGRIHITCRTKPKKLGLGFGPVSSLELHEGMLEITGNDYRRRGASKIGVIFASTYRPKPSALGVMFDRGFRTDDDPKGSHFDYSLPREGCAIFLDAIDARRREMGLPQSTYKKQVVHTTIHELGHVFNLLHTTANTYMRQTGRARAPWRSQRGFSDEEQAWLSRWSADVAPGWRDFRDSSDDSQSMDRGKARAKGLTLFGKLTRKRMARWDPVELELTLALGDNASRSVALPDELDPGYTRLRIMIVEPSGARRVFRTPRHYCDSGPSLTLAPGENHRRDISVFGQSGGYTFTMPGKHFIQAIWEPGGSNPLKTKEIPLDILPDEHPEARASQGLATPQAARALYYRSGTRRSAGFRELERLAASWDGGPNAAHLNYALGRTHAAIWRRLTSSSAAKSRRHVAAEYLKAAVQSKKLGAHARSIGSKILKELMDEAS